MADQAHATAASRSTSDATTTPGEASHDRDIEKESMAPTKTEQSSGPGSTPQFVGFWSPEIKAVRKEYLIGMLRASIMISVLIWAALPIYWGSLYREYLNAPRLHGLIVNRDGNNTIGAAITSGMQQVNADTESAHITWDFVEDVSVWTDEYINDQVAVEENPWAVLVVTEGATAQFISARENGDASWNPESVATLVYSEARNQQAMGAVIVSPTEIEVGTIFSELNAKLASEYLSSIAGNTTAINNLVAAPQTISSPLALGLSNLRPYTVNPYNGAILAATYVGLIYLLVLAFNLVMAGFSIRQKIQRRLKLGSLIAIRILIPVIIYFWLSLMITLLQVAFHLDFNGWGAGYGAGFMVFWMCAFAGMCAMGLCLEAILSLVGPQFVAIGLIYLILTNVSGALLPPDLCGAFYRYSYAMIFYNLKQIFLIIFVNAGKHTMIVKYFFIIFAWVVVICLTFPIWIWRERRSMLKQMKQGGAGAGGPPAGQ